MSTRIAETFRSLPSVDGLLHSLTGSRVTDEAGTQRATTMVRGVIEKMREEIANESYSFDGPMLERAEALLESEWHRMQSRAQQRVINATGVVIHTNLGRSPLSKAAAEALLQVATGYSTTELDLESGKRGKRGGYSEELFCELTGAEAALIVNNCAAAAFLVLTVLASGGDVIISRGELVEIGGDFRVPDVLEQSGCSLREIGTTNRTKLADYERAIGDSTRLILRVHPSNYRIVGFTSTPSLRELAELAHDRSLLLYEDAGSGALSSFKEEPVIHESLKAGADIVTFSGDKLLGGPQCGIIVGRQKLVDRIRKHPLYRALRVDKLVYAALQATLDSYLRRSAGSEIPVRRMLSASADEINARALSFVEALGTVNNAQISITQGESAVGGGAAPDAHLETWLITIKDELGSAEKLAEELRKVETPVIARVSENSLLIDLRTVFPEEETLLAAELRQVLNQFH